MRQTSFKIKLVSIFLVAFVCLNAGGAVCVAFCQTTLESVSAPPEHCPLKKKAGHCDPAGEDKNKPAAESIGDGQVDCCPMTVSFVAAPFESKTYSFETPAIAALAKTRFREPAEFQTVQDSPRYAYRGPPLDRRVDRIKHCILRI